MPKATPNQENFNAGEVSPLLYGRVKSPRYAQALAKCLNYLPLLQGPVTRRPGTKYANNVKDSSNPPILIPFEFSETQAYMLEFGDQYIRFYANNAAIITSGTSYKISGTYSLGQVGIPLNYYATRADLTPKAGENVGTTGSPSPGSILELQTPYLVADLPLLRWCQNADTLYLFHPSYPLKKLQRYGQTYWTLRDVYVQDGPYVGLSSYSTLGDNTNVLLVPASAQVAGKTVAVSTSPVFTITGAASGTGGVVRLTTGSAHGWDSGQKVFVASVVGTTEANNTIVNPLTTPNYWTINVVDSTHIELIGSTFVNAWVSGGQVQPALFTDNSFLLSLTGGLADKGRNIAIIQGSVRTWGIITHVTSPVAATMLIDPNSPGLTNTNASTWYLGSWNVTHGYPACGCFHQNRLILAGIPDFPSEVDGSKTGIFENFGVSKPADLTVASDNALQFQLVANDVNAIHWLKSNAQGLLGGTYGGEWTITPSSQSDALTPTNFNAQKTSAYGAAKLDSVQLGNAVLYIQKGQRKVREMNFFFYAGTFRSTDLTEVSEHITLPLIKQLVAQKHPASLTWGLRTDGQLVNLTYDRDDQNLRTGWAPHQLGGQSDAAGSPPLVLSIGVIPSPDATFDQLWLVVQRWINGAKVVTVEYMTKINDDSVLQEDAFQGDCGATYDSPKTITGITKASPAVVTSATHGFSNGDWVKITDVVGLNENLTDADGNTSIINLVNEKTFVIAGVATNTFQLKDFNGNNIDSTAYSAYVSGGNVRKMISTVTGLTWLENETVGILADGSIHRDLVVSNSGSITLDYKAAKVQIGYRYNSDGQQLRLDAGSATGSSIGLTRRISRVMMMVHRVADLLWGLSFTRLLPQSFERADQQLADNAVALFSGIVQDAVESEYGTESQFCFRQNSMLPGTIQSITQIMEEQDR